VRRAALLVAVVIAGCGTNPQDPGDPQARRVTALDSHVAAIAKRAQAAEGTHEVLVLEELIGEARLAQEDIESTVPFGAPRREEVLRRAQETVRAISSEIAQAQR
jgi:hypothetical protein